MKQNGNQRKLVLIFAWFLIPLTIAFAWYKLLPESMHPSNSTNNGDLLESIFTLEPFNHLTINGHSYANADIEKVWTLVHFVNGDCDEACSQSLYNTRQLRIALGKDVKRLSRLAILEPAGQSESNTKMWASHPDLTVVYSSNNGVAEQIHRNVRGLEIDQNSIFLVDPLGNVMMHFSPTLEPKLIKKDIRKLLKLSHIG